MKSRHILQSHIFIISNEEAGINDQLNTLQPAKVGGYGDRLTVVVIKLSR